MSSPSACCPSPITGTIRFMTKRVKVWYDRKWIMPTLSILTLFSGPFRQDIRKAVEGLGVMFDDRWLDFFLAVGLIGLAVVLMSKSERAARTCEDLHEQLQEDLADQRKKFKEDLANHREQLQKDLAALLDSRLRPIIDGVGTLRSNVSALNSRVSALNSRLDALDSRITALKDTIARSFKRN